MTLRDNLSADPRLSGILIGGLHTENIGIEQIITYVVDNPNIRYLILCGEDGQQAIGHLPGQSFLALAQNGLDPKGSIVGAKGKRPVIHNIPNAMVDHFRENVTVIDHIGCQDTETIVSQVVRCKEEWPGPAERYILETGHATNAPTIPGHIPDHMVIDPKGYFVIGVDQDRHQLLLKHYHNKGTLNLQITGNQPGALYHAAIANELLSLLDHAAYLGLELQRAHQALLTGEEYVQDKRD